MKKAVTAGIIVGGAVLALLFGPRGPLGGFRRPIAIDPEPAGWQLAGLMGSGLTESRRLRPGAGDPRTGPVDVRQSHRHADQSDRGRRRTAVGDRFRPRGAAARESGSI